MSSKVKLSFTAYKAVVFTVMFDCVIWMNVDINSALLRTTLTYMYHKETVMMKFRWKKCKLIHWEILITVSKRSINIPQAGVKNAKLHSFDADL